MHHGIYASILATDIQCYQDSIYYSINGSLVKITSAIQNWKSSFQVSLKFIYTRQEKDNINKLYFVKNVYFLKNVYIYFCKNDIMAKLVLMISEFISMKT